METSKEILRTDIQFYHSTCDAWDTMYEDCLAAERSIEFEQYIIRDDDIGRRFMSLFVSKAKKGVIVNLLLDRVGSRYFYKSEFVKEIREAGGAVNFYNSINWLNLFAPSTWFPRNHTKVMIIDSKIVHIGSVCLADYMAHWRDLHARITGLLVAEIVKDFSYIWKKSTSVQKTKRIMAPSDDPYFDYLIATPRLTPSPIYLELLDHIRRAERYIYMATPYFLPPQGLRRALRMAARKGVDVRVILTEETDVPIALHVSRTYFPQLLKEGIRLFSYKGTVYHAKYSIIDDQWATMGSVNLDYLSLLENREANIVMTHEETIQKLGKEFIKDLSRCDEIKPEFWEKVPLKNKIIGYLGRLVKRMI